MSRKVFQFNKKEIIDALEHYLCHGLEDNESVKEIIIDFEEPQEHLGNERDLKMITLIYKEDE